MTAHIQTLNETQRRAIIRVARDPTLSIMEVCRRLKTPYDATRYWVKRYRTLKILPPFRRTSSEYANLNGGVSETEKVARFRIKAVESDGVFAGAMEGRRFENVAYQEMPFTQVPRPHAAISLVGCAAEMVTA
jgi:hypothetical protein